MVRMYLMARRRKGLRFAAVQNDASGPLPVASFNAAEPSSVVGGQTGSIGERARNVADDPFGI